MVPWPRIGRGSWFADPWQQLSWKLVPHAVSRSPPHCFSQEDAALMLEFTSNKLESPGTAAHFHTVAGHLKYGACLGVFDFVTPLERLWDGSSRIRHLQKWSSGAAVILQIKWSFFWKPVTGLNFWSLSIHWSCMIGFFLHPFVSVKRLPTEVEL